jgi:MYXO-CTERM domain-containing protein
VLGLFPYGPAAGIGGDGTNEIDIEWARWGQADGVNIGFTDYPDSGNTIGTMSYTVSLGGGTASTARFVWTSQFIDNSILKGYQPLGSDAQLIHRWKYAPNNPGTNIPQQALPLGMNLWCFEAPPSDGQNVEIVIRDFQFVKEGDPIPNGGSGGMGGMGSGGMAGAGGKPSIGGNGNGGNGNGGAGPKGGASSGGTANNAGTGSGGISTGGTSNGVPAGGGAQSGGTASNNGGTTSNNGGTSSLPSAGSTSASAGSTNATNNDAADSSSGCACHVAGHRSSSAAIAAFLGLTLLTLRRRIAPA